MLLPVYFVQGILKLAGLALTFYQKDDLKLEPAQVGAPGTVVVVVVVLLLLVLLLCGVIEPGGAAAAGLLVTGVHFLLLLLLSYTRCGPSAPGKGGCRLCMAMLSASKGPS